MFPTTHAHADYNVDNATYMSYCDYVELKDYQGRSIALSDDSWEHIRESHPEITLEDIRLVLIDPMEVRECPRQNFVELF